MARTRDELTPPSLVPLMTGAGWLLEGSGTYCFERLDVWPGGKEGAAEKETEEETAEEGRFRTGGV